MGTDVGAYASGDRGVTWQPFMTGLPNVPVHDLQIHRRDAEVWYRLTKASGPARGAHGCGVARLDRAGASCGCGARFDREGGDGAEASD